jgi:hypothetical protein
MKGVVVVTNNQWRAAVLAADICGHKLDAANLTDPDWDLLLLAADLNNPLSLPLLVCHRVLDRAARGVGYFEGTPIPLELVRGAPDPAAIRCG